MKICYLDESGTGDEPIAVVAGIVVDAHRMHVTKENWTDLLDHISGVVGRQLTELHTKDFYRGNAPFRTLTGPQRAEYISSICQWFCERKHNFVYSGILKEPFLAALAAGSIPHDLANPWRAAAFHVALSLQRAHQAHQKNKGHTLLIFDNKAEEQAPFTRLLLNPPDWSDEYYNRGKKQGKLDQIVDAPYFADSTTVALIQAADFLAFFLRRHAEIAENLIAPRYAEEQDKIQEWVEQLSQRTIGVAHMYPAKGRCKAASEFYDHCPPSLRRLEG
ncbi:MAG: DUF3800 domain-containing protein [Gammaproteobacteria bacterium]